MTDHRCSRCLRNSFDWSRKGESDPLIGLVPMVDFSQLKKNLRARHNTIKVKPYLSVLELCCHLDSLYPVPGQPCCR